MVHITLSCLCIQCIIRILLMKFMRFSAFVPVFFLFKLRNCAVVDRTLIAVYCKSTINYIVDVIIVINHSAKSGRKMIKPKRPAVFYSFGASINWNIFAKGLRAKRVSFINWSVDWKEPRHIWRHTQTHAEMLDKPSERLNWMLKWKENKLQVIIKSEWMHNDSGSSSSSRCDNDSALALNQFGIQWNACAIKERLC